MKTIGLYMSLAGFVSIVLSFFNYELSILRWIENWGSTTAWLIRGALLVVGAVLYFSFGGGQEEEEPRSSV